jgi:hypothetical protein
LASPALLSATMIILSASTSMMREVAWDVEVIIVTVDARAISLTAHRGRLPFSILGILPVRVIKVPEEIDLLAAGNENSDVR